MIGAQSPQKGSSSLTDTEFLRQLEELLSTFGTSYADIGHTGVARLQKVMAFFGGDTPRENRFPHTQVLSRDQFNGWLKSLSYLPQVGDARHPQLLESAERLFESAQQDGRVHILYETVVYSGGLAAE